MPSTLNKVNTWAIQFSPQIVEGYICTPSNIIADKTGATFISLGTAHQWSNNKFIDKQATCTSEGQKSTHCRICNAIQEGSIDIIPMLDHQWKNQLTIDKKPTCTESGQKSIHCITCDSIQIESKEILPALGHAGDIWEEVPATYTSDGKKSRICRRCKETENIIIPMLHQGIPIITPPSSYGKSGIAIRGCISSLSDSNGFEVYRSLSEKEGYTLIGRENISSSTNYFFDDKKVLVGTKYFYKVRSFVSENGKVVYSPFSTVSSCTSKPAPVNSISTAHSPHRVSLSWNDGSNLSDGFLIYAQKNGKYGYVGMTSYSTFTDTNALDNAYNFYWIFPYIKDLNGNLIIGECPQYVYSKGISSSVTNLKATGINSGVKLTWSKSNGAEGYLIYGKTASGKYGYKGMTTKKMEYIYKNASNSEYNFYWVYPYHLTPSGKRIIGESNKYVYAKGLLPLVPNIKATGVKDAVKLTWSYSEGTDGYLIYSKTGSGKYSYKGMTQKLNFIDKKASKSEYNFYWIFSYYKNSSGKMIVGGTPKYVYAKAK